MQNISCGSRELWTPGKADGLTHCRKNHGYAEDPTRMLVPEKMVIQRMLEIEIYCEEWETNHRVSRRISVFTCACMCVLFLVLQRMRNRVFK